VPDHRVELLLVLNTPEWQEKVFLLFKLDEHSCIEHGYRIEIFLAQEPDADSAQHFSEHLRVAFILLAEFVHFGLLVSPEPRVIFFSVRKHAMVVQLLVVLQYSFHLDVLYDLINMHQIF